MSGSSADYLQVQCTTDSRAEAMQLARAAVEAVLCSLADGIGNLADCGITPERVVLIGGAARSQAIQRIAPAIFGVPVAIPDPAEDVALGAARQAAWALARASRSGSGPDGPPGWPGADSGWRSGSCPG